MHRLPLKLRFYKSKLYISALLPVGLGFLIGILSAILGVGGGFILVPAMIYLLGMPTAAVIAGMKASSTHSTTRAKAPASATATASASNRT